ncbi:MAG: T9SS type A sorting domain-containing protein [Fluviicola sp.]
MKKVLLSISVSISLSCLAQIPTTGLAGSYTFNGNANDVSGNNYHGTVNGATLITDRFGNPNFAYHFDGVNDYIDLSAHVAGFTSTNAKSVSFWVRTNYDNPNGDGNTCSSVFSISNGSNGTVNASDIYVGNNSTGSLNNELVSMYSRKDASDYYIAGHTTSNRSLLIDNTWHHIVLNFNNSSTTLYLDGNLLAMSCNYGTNNGHFANQTDATKVMFGTRWANGANGAFMNGDLDDFRFYQRSLTGSEVLQLYNEANPTLSVDEQFNAANLSVYPNPASDVVTVSWDKEMITDMKLELIDFDGRIIRMESVSPNESSVPMDIRDLESGVYFIRLNDSNHPITRKLIIQ